MRLSAGLHRQEMSHQHRRLHQRPLSEFRRVSRFRGRIHLPLPARIHRIKLRGDTLFPRPLLWRMPSVPLSVEDHPQGSLTQLRMGFLFVCLFVDNLISLFVIILFYFIFFWLGEHQRLSEFSVPPRRLHRRCRLLLVPLSARLQRRPLSGNI